MRKPPSLKDTPPPPPPRPFSPFPAGGKYCCATWFHEPLILTLADRGTYGRIRGVHVKDEGMSATVFVRCFMRHGLQGTGQNLLILRNISGQRRLVFNTLLPRMQVNIHDVTLLSLSLGGFPQIGLALGVGGHHRTGPRPIRAARKYGLNGGRPAAA